MSPEQEIIQVEGLKKVFKVHLRNRSDLMAALKSLVAREIKYVEAVSGIDLRIHQGEIRGLIGPNGAGKSTTIKVLSGVLFPTAGKVKVMGYTPWQERENLVKRIGVVFGQKSQLWWDLPAIDAFALNKKMYEIPEEVYTRNIAYFKDLLHIGEVVNKPVRQLSLGERMKCEFACALLHNPPLVFLDEPTIGLDIISKKAIRSFIKKVNHDLGTTFILTTHDLDDIEDLCERVSIINKGTIVFDDPLEKLKTFFASKKIIELRFQREIPRTQLEQFNIISYEPYAARIEIDLASSPLPEEITKIFGLFPIHDININNIAIEEVIKFIYEQ
jgi:ABC-2 type transport system ATP-binding protein